MRNRTPKRAIQDRITEKVARAYREEFPVCQDCGRRPSDSVHEIANGAARRTARGERCCLLSLCLWCHKDLHECRNIARELALKLLGDPEHFDRSRVLELMGYADTFIQFRDVVAYLEMRAE